jgi:hypothetical protein
MRQLRVLLVHNNPVACDGDSDSVRVMDDLAARVRCGGGRARCDWKFVGSTGEDGQRLYIGSVIEPSFGIELLLDDAPKELNSAAAAIRAAARGGGAADAQYDVLPRKVGDFAAASCMQRCNRGVTRGCRCARRGGQRLRMSTQPP